MARKLQNNVAIVQAITPPSPWMTTDQVADYLSVSPGTIRNWISQRYIPFTHHGCITRLHCKIIVWTFSFIADALVQIDDRIRFVTNSEIEKILAFWEYKKEIKAFENIRTKTGRLDNVKQLLAHAQHGDRKHPNIKNLWFSCIFPGHMPNGMKVIRQDEERII